MACGDCSYASREPMRICRVRLGGRVWECVAIFDNASAKADPTQVPQLRYGMYLIFRAAHGSEIHRLDSLRPS